jgi:hypothetical protein
MFGSHLSITGGMHKALLEADRLNMIYVSGFHEYQATLRPRDMMRE